MCRAVVATVVALIGFNLTFASDRKPCSLISIDFLDARIPYSTGASGRPQLLRNGLPADARRGPCNTNSRVEIHCQLIHPVAPTFDAQRTSSTGYTSFLVTQSMAARRIDDFGRLHKRQTHMCTCE